LSELKIAEISAVSSEVQDWSIPSDVSDGEFHKISRETYLNETTRKKSPSVITAYVFNCEKFPENSRIYFSEFEIAYKSYDFYEQNDVKTAELQRTFFLRSM